MDAIEVRQCWKCGEVKALGEFDVRKDTGMRRGTCKECRRQYQKARWKCSTNTTRSTRVIGTRDLYPCRRCTRMLPPDSFPPRARGSVYLHSWCRECFAEYNAERHAREHAREMLRIRRNQRRYVERNIQLVREYLAQHPCVDCGETDPIVLDFDHLRDKKHEISTMVYNAYPWEKILAEIAKCQVRCSNDHRRATYRRRLAVKETRVKDSEPERNRTSDPDVRSVVLYPLSYGLGVNSSG